LTAELLLVLASVGRRPAVEGCWVSGQVRTEFGAHTGPTVPAKTRVGPANGEPIRSPAGAAIRTATWERRHCPAAQDMVDARRDQAEHVPLSDRLYAAKRGLRPRMHATGSSVPLCAAAQQQPERAVVVAAETVADSSDLLDQEADGFGWSVGVSDGVVGAHLLRPAGNVGCGAKPAVLGDVGVGAPQLVYSREVEL